MYYSRSSLVVLVALFTMLPCEASYLLLKIDATPKDIKTTSGIRRSLTLLKLKKYLKWCNRAILYHLFGILILYQLVILEKLNEKVLQKSITSDEQMLAFDERWKKILEGR